MRELPAYKFHVVCELTISEKQSGFCAKPAAGSLAQRLFFQKKLDDKYANKRQQYASGPALAGRRRVGSVAHCHGGHGVSTRAEQARPYGLGQ
jgi:hypothetical protein